MKLRTLTIGAATAATAAILGVTAGPALAAHEAGTTTVALNGAREVGTQGDRNGSGRIDLEFFGPGGNNPPVAFPGAYYVCYSLTVRNIDGVTGLHIHEVERGPGDEHTNPRKLNGPVVVDLLEGDLRYKDADGIVTDGPTAGGTTCATSPEGGAAIDELLDDPSEYYVNVHNAEFPNGAIRGQINNVR